MSCPVDIADGTRSGDVTMQIIKYIERVSQCHLRNPKIFEHYIKLYVDFSKGGARNGFLVIRYLHFCFYFIQLDGFENLDFDLNLLLGNTFTVFFIIRR